MESKVFTLFGASGTMEEIKPVPALPLYCLVYSYGYGMEGTQAAIISEPNQYGTYKAVYLSEYKPGYTTLDKYSRPHSKKFGIGTYFDDQHRTADPAEVERFIKLADAAVIQAAKDEADEKAADEAEQNNLPALYPYLKPHPKDKKERKENLIAALKHNFPGIKFSVRNEHHDTYNISWTLGPTLDEVKAITGKFESYSNDITGDFRDYSPSNFNRVFGGFKYIFESREMPETTYSFEEVKELAEQLGEYPQQTARKIFSPQSFPAGAVITGIEKNPADVCNPYEQFKYTYTAPDPTPAPAKIAEGLNLEIINYSEKAVAVIGDTREVKDTLKQLGGKFNAYLRCGAGWIFSKKKEADLRAALCL